MPSDRNRIYIDIIEEDIIAQDKQAQANYLNTLVNGGILTTNEARTKLGLPPVEGGDILYRPFTKIEDNIIGGETKNKEKNKEDE
jgi:hypothetical protein